MTDLEQILQKIDQGAAQGDTSLIALKSRSLSLETETGPFLLFLMGDSITAIADKVQYPKEVLAVTARTNNWVERKAAFTATGINVPGEIQKNLVNMILATTYLAVKGELAMVMKGERDASQTRFVPKNIGALQTLIEMVNSVNSLESDGKGKGKTPSISGDNVQVNIYGEGAKPEVPQSKADILKAMAGAVVEPRKREE